MRVKLKWTDLNVKPHTTTIYRSDTKPTGTAPTGTVKVVLSKGENQWLDVDVVKGNTYWYTLVTSNGKQTVSSNVIEVLAVSNTGAGPQELISGDLDLGFYTHNIPAAAFITNAKLLAWSGLAGSVNSNEMIWGKFARRGKTLFAPRRAVTSGRVSWNSIYLLGLMYGVNGTGPQNGGNTPTEQMRVISIDGNDYIVRCMTFITDDDNPSRLLPVGVSADNIGPYRSRSEFNDMVMAQHAVYPPNRSHALPSTYMGAYSYYGMKYAVGGFQPICQEINGTHHMTIADGFRSETDTKPMTLGLLLTLSDSSGNYGWWPVLELIEQVEVSV